jgi:hypothetical protein
LVLLTSYTTTTNGIQLGTFDALYYELPTSNSSFATVNTNFYIVSYLNTSWVPKHNWILVASLNVDPGGGVKWLPGQVTIPLPSSGNSNTWSASSYYTSRPQVEARINFGTTPTIVSSYWYSNNNSIKRCEYCNRSIYNHIPYSGC